MEPRALRNQVTDFKAFETSPQHCWKCGFIRGTRRPQNVRPVASLYSSLWQFITSVWNKRQKSHLLSQNVDPYRTSSVLARGKSRVLPTDPLFHSASKKLVRVNWRYSLKGISDQKLKRSNRVMVTQPQSSALKMIGSKSEHKESWTVSPFYSYILAI